MNFKLLLSFSALVILVSLACSPKIVEKPTEEEKPKEVTPPVTDEKLSDCVKFFEAPDPDEAETAHVLYRDLLKKKNYDEALPLWEKAYKMAPAADGKRDYHFLDGIKIYKHYYTAETDAAKKKEFADKIMDLYDEATKCYPENAMTYTGLKGFNMYYTFGGETSKVDAYNTFKKVIDSEGEKTPDFVLNPFSSLLRERFNNKEISVDEAKKYVGKVMEALKYGMKNAKTAKEKDRWDIVNGYAPALFEGFEAQKNFYDCNYYVDKYMPDFEAAPTDCEVINLVYSRLKWGGCQDANPSLSKIRTAKQTHCKVIVEPNEPSKLRLARQALEEGRYDESIQLFDEAINEMSDQNKKAKYTLLIAKIYYSHKKNFSKARQYANKAADMRGGWGAPYMLIGRMYASSGPLCGPGRGWDSQIVIWPAMDMWNKAKSVDPSSAPEANKFIGQYRQYLPTVEDAFLRGVKEGATYKVPCWISRSTKVRLIK